MKINAITPSGYLIRTTSTNKIQESKFQNINSSLPNHNAILPLKNQILFKGANENKNAPITISPMRYWQLEELQSKTGYRFSSNELLNRAFVHHSILDKQNIAPTIKYDYRTMANLGDNALKMSLAKAIYSEKDDIEPPKVIEIQKRLLSEENLIRHSKNLGLDEYLLIDEEYLRGRTPKKPYADIYRAFVGAMVMDDLNYDFEDICRFTQEEFINEIKKECSNSAESAVLQLRKHIENKGFDASKIKYQTVMKNDGYASRVYYDRKFLATAFEKYKEKAENKAAQNALIALENKFVKL